MGSGTEKFFNATVSGRENEFLANANMTTLYTKFLGTAKIGIFFVDLRL